MNEPQEQDHLRYVGNKFPRVLRLAWTLFFIGAAFYLAKFMWPDLVRWMN